MYVGAVPGELGEDNELDHKLLGGTLAFASYEFPKRQSDIGSQKQSLCLVGVTGKLRDAIENEALIPNCRVPGVRARQIQRIRWFTTILRENLEDERQTNELG